MQNPYFMGAPAELAFFFLLSMVPLTVVVAELLGIFSISYNLFYNIVEKYAGEEFAEIIISNFSYEPSGTINVAFIIFALWAASRGQYALIRISNYSYGYEGSEIRFYRERFRAIMTMIITIFMVAFSLVILVYGDVILKGVDYYLYELFGMGIEISSIWFVLRWILALAIYFFVISITYSILPRNRQKLTDIFPGSIFASSGMLIVTAAYATYISRFANYDVLYGGLAAIVALLIWFYFLGFVLVIGIQINIVWENLSEGQDKKTKKDHGSLVDTAIDGEHFDKK